MEPVLETSANTLREQDAARRQIRGSSLLLLGRVLSLGINFFTQVLMIRYLSTRDFGELAYGLAVVSLFRVFASVGLQDAIPRYVPIYRENREYGKMFGTILLALGAVLATGVLIVVVVWLGPLFLMSSPARETLPHLTVFSILIVIAGSSSFLVCIFVLFGRGITLGNHSGRSTGARRDAPGERFPCRP